MSLPTRAAVAVAAAARAAALAFPAAHAQDAISAPAAKTIGVAKPEMVPSLIVLNAGGAILAGDTLTLTGVASNAILFADRPVRSAGHALTAHLLEEWNADDSFGKDPPNATVSVFNDKADGVADAVVVLKSPQLEGSTLTFKVDLLEGTLPAADTTGPAAVFIDIIGLPFTPLSYAGVARAHGLPGSLVRRCCRGCRSRRCCLSGLPRPVLSPAALRPLSPPALLLGLRTAHGCHAGEVIRR